MKPEDGAEQEFQDFFVSAEASDLIISAEKAISTVEKNNWHVTLKAPENKTAFLKLLSEKTKMSLDSFAVAEPTLEEIFVEKAGTEDA